MVSEKIICHIMKKKVLVLGFYSSFRFKKMIPSFTVCNHPRSVAHIATLPRGCARSFRRRCEPIRGAAQRCQPPSGDLKLASCCQMLPYMIQRKNIFTLRLFGKAFN